MIFSLRSLPMVAAALVAAAPCCWAQVPASPANFSFSTDNAAPVWDLTASYQIQENLIGAGGTLIPLNFSIDVAQDARGSLTGAGEIVVNVGNDFVAAAYTVRGRIHGSGTDARVSLVIHLAGEDVIAGINTPFNITILYTLTVTPDSGSLEGTGRGSAHFTRLGSARIRSDVSLPLPAAANGIWTAQINFLPLSHVAGLATLSFPTGRVLFLNVSGSFSPAFNALVVHLSGVGDSRGNSVTAIITVAEDGSAVVQNIRGRVLGQTVNTAFEPPPSPGG